MPRYVPALLAALSLACLTTAVLSQDAKPTPETPKETPKAEEKPAEPVKQAPKPVDPRQFRIGELIEDLAFTDAEGKAGKLSDFKGKPLVIAMTNATCPICKKYAPTLAELHKELGDQGVNMLLLNASADDVATIEDAIARYKFAARYVVDAKGQIAAALRANSTADCFLLDGARTLVYRGAVDDQHGLGYSVDKPRRNYLRDAVAALLAGERPYATATWAPGCALEFKQASPAGEITWHNRVSRLVQDNCQECHRKGEPGPFELMSLEDVKAHASTIKRVVRTNAMPPWSADPNVGAWHNDRSLSEHDKLDLLRWIERGMKVGDEKDAALARQWPQGWRIGKPDDIVKIPAVVKVPAKGVLSYRYNSIETKFGEDKWVQAMEIRPTASQAVHHVLIFLMYPPDHPRAKEQPNDQFGVKGYFMGMVPGQGHIVFPQGHGKFIPKGATMVFQVHYTPNGEECEDQTALGIIWCKQKPDVEVRTAGIANQRLKIPPGEANYECKSSQRFEKAIRVLSMMPHMHVRGKAYRFEVEYPDGRKEMLLDVPQYQFDWQFVYILREPLDLPAGSRIRCTGWFDNSDKNPANPDPKAEVRFGEQTWDEMQIGYVNYIELP